VVDMGTPAQRRPTSRPPSARGSSNSASDVVVSLSGAEMAVGTDPLRRRTESGNGLETLLLTGSPQPSYVSKC
jgi:hypothetical protein